MSETPFDFLMNLLDDAAAEVRVHQADRDGMSGILFVTLEDSTEFSIHFSKC
jgi:hypothetical protein